MREGRYKLGRVSLIFVSTLLFAGGTAAQDGTGRSESIEKPSIARRKVPRDAIRSSAAPAPVRRIELGKLALTVNEGGSSVRITRLDSTDSADVIPVFSNSSSLIMRTLAAGTYRIAVNKAGYAEETRDIEIADGKQQRISILLKPNMSFLTVAASIPDAKVEIEKVGVYNPLAGKMMLKPGRYRVSVSRRGYVPQTVSVDLNTPGREENVRVLLKPQRIDDVLEDAAEDLTKGNYQMAADLARDILNLNSAHARANLIFGMVEFRRGGSEAASYFLRAVRGGETFRLPVKIQEAQSTDLRDAELVVSRDGVSIKSSTRFDLDFTIARPNVTELKQFPLPGSGFIVLSGKSTFHGRPIAPYVRIYTHDVVAGDAPGTTKCATGNCARETAEIARFMQEWRASN